MVNIHNRRQILEKLPEPGLMGGIVPVAPINQLAMLRDYIEPGERLVSCTNQDVVYGFGIFALDKEPVAVQVPDFGDRFWVYQIVDQRTDSFAEVGKMYGSKPGFHMLAGPDWKGTTPAGITATFRSKTNLGVIIPRAFLDDTAADREAIQPALSRILMYLLSKFSGQQQTKDWSAVPTFPFTAQGDEEVKWVEPKPFFDELGDVLKECWKHSGKLLPRQEFWTPRRLIRRFTPRWCKRRWMRIRAWLARYSSSITTACHFRTTGRRRVTARSSARIISRARQSRNRTFS